MKKTLAILSALVALIACSKEAPVVEEPTQKEKQEIKVNITISRTEMDAETKANIKSGWANDDVVYVFFSEAIAPAYLEMKYNSSSTGWTATPKNELNLATLDGSGSMWAVYLPYGSEYKVIADGTSYTIKSKATDGEDYSGHFFYCEPQDYTISGSTLSGKISLNVASPVTDGDVLVHFDVTNATAGSEYLMYQEYLKPMSLSSISAAGSINKTVGSPGTAIPGYKDASFVSFSGVLGKDYKTARTYWFSIRDTELGTLYYRDAGFHAISANKYIGLGSFSEKWSIANPGVFTANVFGDKITFARSNLSYRGATGGGKPWQLMKYPWSTIETVGEFIPASNKDFGFFGWGTSMFNEKNPWMYEATASNYGPSDIKVNESWTQYDDSKWDWAVNNDIYEYGGRDLSGSWHTPTKAEWEYIINTRSDEYRFAKCDLRRDGTHIHGLLLFPDSFVCPAGITINNVNVATWAAAFPGNILYNTTWNKLEAAGVVFLPVGRRSINGDYVTKIDAMYNGNENDGQGSYWTSDNASWKDGACYFTFSNGSATGGVLITDARKYYGFSVRLVRDLNSISVDNYDTWSNNDI